MGYERIENGKLAAFFVSPPGDRDVSCHSWPQKGSYRQCLVSCNCVTELCAVHK